MSFRLFPTCLALACVALPTCPLAMAEAERYLDLAAAEERDDRRLVVLDAHLPVTLAPRALHPGPLPRHDLRVRLRHDLHFQRPAREIAALEAENARAGIRKRVRHGAATRAAATAHRLAIRRVGPQRPRPGAGSRTGW